MNEYRITTKDGFVLALGYDDGVLVSFGITKTGQVNPFSVQKMLTWLTANCTGEEELLETKSTMKTTRVEFLPPTPIIFDAFWEAYRHKIGNKPRALKLWNGLPPADQHAIIKALPRYDAYLKRTNIAKAYAETFLSQRRWENEYK